MKSGITRLSFIACVLLMAGCAGKNFVRVTDDALVLGETTRQQITARLGSPYQQGTVTKNGQQIATASYAYSSAGGKAAVKGVTPARSQGFYFFNEVLVGYEFTSSWMEDSSDFDDSKVSMIKKGKSTRGDVIKLLGPPGGKYTYPVIPNKSEQAINYLYSQTSGSAFNLKFYQKLLTVTFNKAGVVSNIEYVETGQK